MEEEIFDEPIRNDFLMHKFHRNNVRDPGGKYIQAEANNNDNEKSQKSLSQKSIVQRQ